MLIIGFTSAILWVLFHSFPAIHIRLYVFHLEDLEFNGKNFVRECQFIYQILGSDKVYMYVCMYVRMYVCELSVV